MVEMKVKAVAYDVDAKQPLMILTDSEERRFIPIWIGDSEAQAIACELDHTPPPRPVTHDLMKTMLDDLHTKVRRIIVNDLQGKTYFARVVVETEGRETEYDARPSDSVALAVRYNAPIFVTENVIQKAAIHDKHKMQEEKQRFHEFVQSVSPEMFTGAQPQPGALRPGAPQPGAPQPGAPQPGAPDPGNTRPEKPGPAGKEPPEKEG